MMSVKFYSRPANWADVGEPDSFGYDGSVALADMSDAELQRGARALDCIYGDCIAVCIEHNAARTFTRHTEA